MSSMSTLDAVVEAALRAATRAPSPHNTQPWRFEVAGGRIDVFLDPERVLVVADSQGREARLSCGAALFNLRLALRAAGRGVVVDPLPDRTRPDLLATVLIRGQHTPVAEELALASAIPRRTSNRRPFTDTPVPASVRRQLCRAAEADGSHLVLLEEPALLSGLADLLRRAENVQAEDTAFQAEVRRWTVDRADGADGVPRSAGGPRPAASAVLSLRRYGESTVEREFEQDPLVAVLATPGDTVLDQVRAGAAMQHVLLSATVAGVSASFLSQPVELAQTRPLLRSLIGGREHPQTVFRLGYGYTVPETPRRAVSEVTTIVPGEQS